MNAMMMQAGRTGVQTMGSAILLRLAISILGFAVVLALTFIVPTNMPGQISASQMTWHGAPECASCPPTEQLVAAALSAGEDRWFLNIKFAAPPFNSVLRIAFAGTSAVLELRQVGKTWRGPADRASVPPVASVTQRDTLLIVGLPAELHITGVALSTSSGDRLPESGFMAPMFPGAAQFNATDVTILLILGLSGWFGFRRGMSAEIVDLIVLIVSVVLSAIVARPLGAWIAGLTGSPRAGAALAGGIMVVLLAIAGFLLVPKMLGSIGAGAKELDLRLSGAFGSAAACTRQMMVVAMLLTVGTDLSVLRWASSNIQSSLIGGPLVDAWHTLFR
jgi:uncharacterized membrane protein required for colicin V production